MYKTIVMLVVAVSVSASAETCRVVKKQSRPAAVSATFCCLPDEHLGATLPCRDSNGGTFAQVLLSDKKFKCSDGYAFSEGWLCSDADDGQDDISCIPPIQADYLCCK